MGKITVKHYLNKSTSKKAAGKDGKQQVYVQVTVKRQVNRMRSEVDQFLERESYESRYTPSEIGLTKQELDYALKNEQSDWGKALMLQRKIIVDVITFLDPFNRDNFSIQNFTQIYELATEHIIRLIRYRALDYLSQALVKKWGKLLDVLDYSKSFQSIYQGLESIGIANTEFNQLVLLNEKVQIASVASTNIAGFLNSRVRVSPFDELCPLAFYWFQEDITRDFIKYVLERNEIATQQIPLMEKYFEEISDTIFPFMKMASSKR